MPFTFADGLYGFVIPALAAAALRWLLRRRATGGAFRRAETIVPLVAGFHVGYWMLSLGPVVPQSHWQWLPWVLLASLAAALPPLVKPSAVVLRALLTLVMAGLAAWLLVPTWEHLQPSRSVHLLAFTTIVAVTTTLLEPLPRRFPGTGFPAMLAGVLACGALVLALSGSLRFAQMAGCGVAALAGMTAAEFYDRQRGSFDGIALPFTLLISGTMLIGRVNSFSDVPLISYLLPPLAPLSLWLGDGSRRRPATASRLQRFAWPALPLLMSATAVGIAVLAQ